MPDSQTIKAQMSDFENKKHHFVFVTTCTVTGKQFVDFHSTDDMNDGYLGRARLLQDSIDQHGVQAHERTILEHAVDREEVEYKGAKYKKTARCLAKNVPFEERTSRSPYKIETSNWSR
jgi:hypothetical protein